MLFASLIRRPPKSTLFPYTTALPIFQDEVREILAEARCDAEHTKNDIIATAQKEADATRQRAIADIERARSEEHTSELQSRENLVCRLLLEKKKSNRQPACNTQQLAL